MDAADMAHKLGAEELFIVFGGPRSEMHWHRPDSWFATPGVHALMLCNPLGYEKSGDGTLHGLRVRHREFDREWILKVDMAIESMGLAPSEDLTAVFGGKVPTSAAGFRTGLDSVYVAGGLINGGASVVQCVAEGREAAECIHSDFVL
jgi:NADPH-dependent glutamate synthase beta subunit-like oxidoreductase